MTLLATFAAAAFGNPETSVLFFAAFLITLLVLEFLPAGKWTDAADFVGGARGEETRSPARSSTLRGVLLLVGGAFLLVAIFFPSGDGQQSNWDWRMGLGNSLIGLAVLLRQLERKSIGGSSQLRV